MTESDTTRRRFLRAGVAATTLALAGCSGGGDDGGDGTTSAPSAPDDTATPGGSTATETTTGTETGTETTDGPPAVSFAFEQRALAGVALIHDGGEGLATGQLVVEVGGTVAYEGGSFRNGFGDGAAAADGWADGVAAGDRLLLAPAGGLSASDEVTVLWTGGDEPERLGGTQLETPSYGLGGVLPLQFEAGEAMRVATERAVARARGGGEFDFELADGAANVDRTVQIAGQFADQGRDAVIGPAIGQTLVAATESVFGPEELLACTPAANVPELRETAGNEYVFRTLPTISSQSALLARFLAERDGAPGVAILAGTSSTSEAFVDAFTAAYEGTVATTVTVESGGDYGGAVTEALSANPDALVVDPATLNYGLLAEALFADPGVGSLPVRGASGLAVLAEFVELPSTADVAGVSPDPTGTDIEAITDDLASGGVDSPDHLAYTAYDAGAVVTLAVAYADATDRDLPAAMRAVADGDGETVTPTTLGDGVARAVRGQPVAYSGVSGSLAFDAAGDVAAPTLSTWTYAEGAVTVDGTIGGE